MRKILGVVATAAVASILTIPTASASDCLPLPFYKYGLDMCVQNPVDLQP